MKLQKEELAAVASHILEEIKKKNSVPITKEEKKEVAKLIEFRNDANEKISKLQTESRTKLEAFNKKYGILLQYNPTTDVLEKALQQKKNKTVPTLDDIKKKIILKSLFSDEKELQSFMKELIAEY